MACGDFGSDVTITQISFVFILSNEISCNSPLADDNICGHIITSAWIESQPEARAERTFSAFIAIDASS